jgi:hypothetical protein
MIGIFDILPDHRIASKHCWRAGNLIHVKIRALQAPVL